MLSTTAYDALRRLLVLPYGRTLRNYIHYIKAGFGIQQELSYGNGYHGELERTPEICQHDI